MRARKKQEIFRLRSHPIIDIEERGEISFTFNGQELKALEGEVITSALFANGYKIFGHHPRDGGHPYPGPLVGDGDRDEFELVLRSLDRFQSHARIFALEVSAH